VHHPAIAHIITLLLNDAGISFYADDNSRAMSAIEQSVHTSATGEFHGGKFMSSFTGKSVDVDRI
jgi:hypothetical protein